MENGAPNHCNFSVHEVKRASAALPLPKARAKAVKPINLAPKFYRESEVQQFLILTQAPCMSMKPLTALRFNYRLTECQVGNSSPYKN